MEIDGQMILRADGDCWSMAVSTSLFTSGSSINPGSSAPLLAPPPTSGSPTHFWPPHPLLDPPPTSGSPVFLTPKSHSWLPLLVLSLKICLTSSCNEVKQPHEGRGIHPKWSTPRGVVYTISRGVHPKWPTPPGVVHTISRGVHPKWPTPPGVVHTISRGVHHQPWRTPSAVAYTQIGLLEAWRTPKVVYTQGDLPGPPKSAYRVIRNSMKQGGIAHWP